jgi:uncharacterized protein (DUF2147 family)
MMKRLFALAAFLLASTAAQAQYTFEYGGRTIRVDPDRGTVSIPGVYDNSGRRKRQHGSQDNDRPHKQPPQQVKVDPQAPAPAPAQADPAASPAVAPTPAAPEPASTTANATPTGLPAPPPPASAAPAPQVQQGTAPAANPEPVPLVAAAPPTTPAPSPPAPATPALAANSPLGLWLTEEKQGKVRIEQCGVNLCGYSVDAKSNQNGEQVLINMKPDKDSQWKGRIFDPNTGSTYDSTIALRGAGTLRVEGCAFGGMFCGGQTWSRLD